VGFARWWPYGGEYAVFHVESGEHIAELEHVHSNLLGDGWRHAIVAAAEDDSLLASWLDNQLDVRDFRDRSGLRQVFEGHDVTLAVRGRTVLVSSETKLDFFDPMKRGVIASRILPVVWLDDHGKPRRANSYPELRRSGLLVPREALTALRGAVRGALASSTLESESRVATPS